MDFLTIHCGINRRVIKTFKEAGRLMNIVSRGGSLLFGWMEVTGNENPFYEHYDEVLEILHEHDVTISLGDPAARDACPMPTMPQRRRADRARQAHQARLGRRRAGDGRGPGPYGPQRDRGEHGAGEAPVPRRALLCAGAARHRHRPRLRPHHRCHRRSDRGLAGADFLCYVTPAEHLRLPDADDVREGLVATKIAAHAADIAKGIPRARDGDNRMSDARRRVDWDEQFA